MNTNQDRLDVAIDLVTARMTAVKADAALATRIAHTLPDRPVWFPRVWIARLAMGALASLAITAVLGTFHEPPTVAGPAKAGYHSGSITPAPARTADATTIPVEPRGVSLQSAVRPTDSATVVDQLDHEFSLPPISTAVALDVGALAPSELEVGPDLMLAPLVIADLPSSSDCSPH